MGIEQKGNQLNTPQFTAESSHHQSLADLQRFNETVYGEVNRRNFELTDMTCRLSRYDARVSLRIRQDKTERTPYHLCMMLSWTLAVANRLCVRADEEVVTFCAITLPETAPLSELQTLFAKRHADTTIEKAGLCLAEKVQGLASALEYYRETHEQGHFREAEKRIAQIIESLCVVAHLLGVNLSEAFEENFKGGCNTCHNIPCGCGFRADKVM